MQVYKVYTCQRRYTSCRTRAARCPLPPSQVGGPSVGFRLLLFASSHLDYLGFGCVCVCFFSLVPALLTSVSHLQISPPELKPPAETASVGLTLSFTPHPRPPCLLHVEPHAQYLTMKFCSFGSRYAGYGLAAGGRRQQSSAPFFQRVFIDDKWLQTVFFFLG